MTVRHPATIRPQVLGVGTDPQTRCAHYHSDLDIVAIKLRCCGEYYACKDCHDALADHALQQWHRDEYDTRAVVCGACGAELTIHQYLACNHTCPECGAAFNPRCAAHHRFYFSDR
jgi:uncharacterized CHY-type Zn-finger protein